MSTPRSPGQRAGLTREAVLDAARELLREGGTNALTMRALARTLSVAPNAVYSHVEDKTRLLDDLLDDLLSTVDPPATDIDDPVAGLHELMFDSFAVLTENPELVPIYVARQGARGSNAVRLGEIMDVLLDRAGVSGAAAARARRVLIGHTIGAAALATGAPENDQPLPPAESRRDFSQSLTWLLTGITQ